MLGRHAWKPGVCWRATAARGGWVLGGGFGGGDSNKAAEVGSSAGLEPEPLKVGSARKGEKEQSVGAKVGRDKERPE